MHVPHIGDTVLVHHKDCHNNGAETVPAIVQQVFDQNGPGQPVYCNLIAFPPFATPKQLGSVTFFQSTPVIPDEHFVGCWPKQERPVYADNGQHMVGTPPMGHGSASVIPAGFGATFAPALPK